jgi:hypothetical protein
MQNLEAAIDSENPGPALARLATAYGRDWPILVGGMPRPFQVVAAEAGVARLAGATEGDWLAEAATRYPAHTLPGAPYATAPDLVSQARLELCYEGLWPWQITPRTAG